MSPHTVFIIPYRDRAEHKRRFEIYIAEVLRYNQWTEGIDVDIFFTHQCDKRSFNRGGMKNMGLKLLKDKYPHYKNITMVFHDIDSIPNSPSLFPYKTTVGKVAHYYGFTFVLGGILAIKAGDFELVNGFPCFWGWGLEDNALQTRCLSNGIEIDRSIFVPVLDKSVSRDGELPVRTWSKDEGYMYKKGAKCGYDKMKHIKYTIDGRMMNVTHFDPLSPYDESSMVTTKPFRKIPIIHPLRNTFSNIIYGKRKNN